MKKIISILIIAFMLLSVCSCKKEEEQRAASDVLAENAQSTQNNQQDFQKTEAETPEEEKKEHTPAEKTEPEKESLQVQEPENTEQENESEQQPVTVSKRVSYIQVELNGTDYYHYPDMTQYGLKAPATYITVFEDIDKGALKPTSVKVSAVYYTPSEIDGYTEFKREDATVYQLPPEVENDPYIDALAVKLQDEEHITIFANMKKAVEGEKLLYDFLKINKYYGYACTTIEDIQSIDMIKSYTEERVQITDKDKISKLYNKIIECKYSDKDIKTEKSDKNTFGCYIVINFKDGFSYTQKYESERNAFLRGYVADEGFGEYLKSFFKED